MSPIEPATPVCPAYTQKENTILGKATDLPRGFFAFSRFDTSGVFLSPIRRFEPHLVPNTGSDTPGNISISENGEWLCYLDRGRRRIILIARDGCPKMEVPVSDCDPNYPTMAAFYRRSPLAERGQVDEEIYYLAGPSRLKSVQVNYTADGAKFSGDRILVDVGHSHFLNPDEPMQVSVVGDQVFAEISPIIQGRILSRTGYLTIPEEGKGVGGPDDVYKWAKAPESVLDGCGHTQSWDGELALANPGSRLGKPECVPHAHKGFYITRFRRIEEAPIDFLRGHVDSHAISINWCPPDLRPYSQSEVDFWGWQFGNLNQYVIGRQAGSRYGRGIWMIDWPRNIWYRLSPQDRNLSVFQPAVFFSSSEMQAPAHESCSLLPKDSGNVPERDVWNPKYRILSPNGGEKFTIGDTCEVRVSAIRAGNAMLSLTPDSGQTWMNLPGLDRSINPLQESVFYFMIPEIWESGEKRLNSVSDQYFVRILDYSSPEYWDVSDQPFQVEGNQP